MCKERILGNVIIWLIMSLPLISCQTVPIYQEPWLLYHQPIKYGEVIEMPTYSVGAPSGEGWGFLSDKERGNVTFFKNKVIRVPDLYIPDVQGQTSIQLRKIRELNQEKWELNEDEFSNDFINTEENKEMKEREEVSKRIGMKSVLDNVSRGVIKMDSKKIYFLKYKIFRRWGYDTEVDLYLFIPPNFKETHIFYTFKIEEIYLHGARKSFHVDLDQILPVIKSFQIKNVTEE